MSHETGMQDKVSSEQRLGVCEGLGLLSARVSIASASGYNPQSTAARQLDRVLDASMRHTGSQKHTAARLHAQHPLLTAAYGPEC